MLDQLPMFTGTDCNTAKQMVKPWMHAFAVCEEGFPEQQ